MQTVLETNQSFRMGKSKCRLNSLHLRVVLNLKQFLNRRHLIFIDLAELLSQYQFAKEEFCLSINYAQRFIAVGKDWRKLVPA